MCPLLKSPCNQWSLIAAVWSCVCWGWLGLQYCKKNAESLPLCRKVLKYFIRSSGYHALSFLILRLSPSYKLPPVVPGVGQAQNKRQSASALPCTKAKGTTPGDSLMCSKLSQPVCLISSLPSLSSQCHLGVWFAFCKGIPAKSCFPGILPYRVGRLIEFTACRAYPSALRYLLTCGVMTC